MCSTHTSGGCGSRDGIVLYPAVDIKKNNHTVR